MTEASAMKTNVMARLEQLRAETGTKRRARSRCDALIAKLRAPVRIGLFGLPGAGKRHMLNAICGTAFADPSLALPTFELSHGPKAETQAMLPDGSYLCSDGFPASDLLRHQPVFLRITSPARVLEGRKVLLVASDSNETDLRAGLDWASTRVDVAVWCTRGWTALEQTIWRAAPDTLRNHAILVGTEAGSDRRDTEIDDGFSARFDIRLLGIPDKQDTDEAVTRFAEYLSTVIDEASTQDLLAARLFLQRHGADVPDPGTGLDAVGVPNDTGKSVTAASRPPPEDTSQAVADLSRLFQFVRSSADDLRVSIAAGVGAVDDPEHLLTEFETIFETLCDRASDMAELDETWPDFERLLSEARDLSLLLRMEGGAEQVTDAARLLLQVRQDIETRLAA